MIAQIRGILTHKEPEGLVIDVNGVGYEVTVSLNTFYQLPEVNLEVTLLIHTHVTEGAFSLFGFLDPSEKSLFKKLISVSGIGPRVGLAILSGLPPADLTEAIAGKNLAKLTSISGIGKKTAERMVMELKDKVQPFTEKNLTASALQTSLSSREKTYAEALSALMNLGYQRTLAEKALSQISIQTDSNIEKVLKDSLGVLAR